MPPDCRHACLVAGSAISQAIVSNPGILQHVSVHVSVRNMKSILTIVSRKSLFLDLSPRTLLNKPLIFHVLNEMLGIIFFVISSYMIENAILIVNSFQVFKF